MLRRTFALPAWPAALYPAALLLALALPFEVIQPVVVTPWLALSDEKLVLLLATGAWLLLGAQAVPTSAEWRALRPSLALLAVALVAAVLAPEFGDEALRFVWRLAAAAFVLLLAVRLASDRGRLTGLVWAIVGGAGISGLLGLGEAAGWLWLTSTFDLFKVAPTRVGGELRVSASFQYATIAAMYFEMAVPLAIGLAATASRRWQRLAAVAIGGVCTANVVLSLTRAGILTLGVVFALFLLAAWLRQGLRRVRRPTLVCTAVLVGGVGILAARNPVFDMRLMTESDADWYGAAYAAPPTLAVEADQQVSVALDVRNEGRMVWSSSEKHPFALGYRWLTADGQGVLDVRPGEVPLTHDVAPGETIHLQAHVQVPARPPGAYRLDWGMLQRDVLKFHERGWANAETAVAVQPSAYAMVDLGRSPTGVAVGPAISPRDDGEAPWVVGRLELWGAALRLIQTRPLLGVGPDNFRHLYGAQLGLETWDERVQANNLYLEILVDLGLLGLVAFAWLMAAPLLVARRALNLPEAEHVGTVFVLGIALAVVAFLLHGLLDSFLAFTPTALLLWLLLGLLLAQKPQVSGR